MAALHGKAVTQELSAFAAVPKTFHSCKLGRMSSVCIFLVESPSVNLVLCHEPDVEMNTLIVYSVTIGEGGVRVGYVFCSPLRLRCDPYFALFMRKAHPIRDIIKQAPIEKQYVLNKEIIVFRHEMGYMLTRLEENSVTRMLKS